MKRKPLVRLAATLLSVFLLLPLAGCGNGEKTESASGEKEAGVGNAQMTRRQLLVNEAISLLRKFAEEITSIKVGDIRTAKLAVLEIELLEIQFQELGVKMEAAGPPDAAQADAFRAEALAKVSEVQDERFVEAVTAIGEDPTTNQLVTGATNRFRDVLDRQIFRDYGIGGD